jgi:hypothetical protein
MHKYEFYGTWDECEKYWNDKNLNDKDVIIKNKNERMKENKIYQEELIKEKELKKKIYQNYILKKEKTKKNISKKLILKYVNNIEL